MQIKSKKLKDSLFIYLHGELDECSSHECRMLLDKLIDEAEDIKKVIFEMGNLNFMDSTGIGVLIGRYKKLKNKNIGLYLQNPPLHIEKIIQLSGLYSIMPKL